MTAIITLEGRPNKVWATAAIVVTYVVAYVGLDRLRFNNPLHGIGITPWDPSSGLTLAFLMVKGLRYTPAVALAELLSSEYLPLVPIPLFAALGGALVITGGYAFAAVILRHMLPESVNLYRAQDVALLLAVTLVASGVVAVGYVAVYAAAGIVPWTGYTEGAFQYWIGDAIGVGVLTPLLLQCVNRLSRPWKVPDHPERRAIEAALQGLAIAAALAVVVGLDPDHEQFSRFYLLFLPLIWIATRQGIAGATWAALVIQAGLIAALEVQEQSAATVRSYQMLMFALTTTGLMLGAVVTERERGRQALSEAMSRLGAILNTASDAVLTVDRRGRIESVNAAGGATVRTVGACTHRVRRPRPPGGT
jgi:two-component system, LuxR family, sensor kinase FixL